MGIQIRLRSSVTLRTPKKKFLHIFSYNLLTGTLSLGLKIEFLLIFCIKILFASIIQSAQQKESTYLWEKGRILEALRFLFWFRIRIPNTGYYRRSRFEPSNTASNTFSYSTFSKQCQSSSILHENWMFLKILWQLQTDRQGDRQWLTNRQTTLAIDERQIATK